MSDIPTPPPGERSWPPSRWLASLGALLTEELASRPRRLRTSLRTATLATVGIGLMAACHVSNPLGPYIVWLMIGPVAMTSLWQASVRLAAVGAMLAASVPLAGILAEAPWLMLSFIGGFGALSTYLIASRKLGSFGLVLQVTTLDAFYGVIFAHHDFGSGAASLFGGCVIAFGLIAVFDRWIWPDPAETILLQSLAASAERIRARLAKVTDYYLGERGVKRPHEPPATSEISMQLGLLDRALAEGVTPHRRAVLLAAITRIERLHIEADRLTVAAREDVPHEVRNMVRPEIIAARDAIAAALGEIAREVLVLIRTGPDEPPSPQAATVRPALEALQARTAEVRPAYIGWVSASDLSNFGALTQTLENMGRLLERPLDAPPAPAASAAQSARTLPATSDPALTRYSAKTGLCLVIGYFAGLVAQRPELSVILTTIVITALPTYGASLRKMILRIAGSLMGGVVALVAIMLVTPNFENLPAYLLATFIVLFISAYGSLGSGRTAYAGKSIGTTFVLVFAGLSPALDFYAPLWRIWGILLGTVIVTIIFLMLWPVYAGDSLMPRLRKVISDTLALTPGGSRSDSPARIRAANGEIAHVLSEILEVADDARVEGRRSLIDHDAVVQAAGTIRRIAHRLAALAVAVIDNPLPKLDNETEAAHDAVLAAIRKRLEAWLAFYESGRNLSQSAALALAAAHSRNEIAHPLEQFTSRIEADAFARIDSWTFEQRRQILAEMQSLRRLDFLMAELDQYLSEIPGPSPAAALVTALQTESA